jgi:predicted nucleic acid-binding protein
MTGLSYNLAARSEFLADGHGTEEELEELAQHYSIMLIIDITDADIDTTALQLRSAFHGDQLGRVLALPDARILATAFLKNEILATGDARFFKRARDLGVSAEFIGHGSAVTRAVGYSPRPVTVPKKP